ncbi:MAG: hypothetical protein QNK37_33845 [Acidobacteriota bacterium]|nr:hypothetical protein [Acidobacteriota bacterium]
MPHLRVLLETRFEDRRAYCCSDTESNFLILLFNKRTHVDSFVTNDFLFGVGHAYSFLMENRELDILERHAAEIESPANVFTDITSMSPGVVRLDMKTGKKLLFSRYLSNELDAQMMAESYLDALRGWSLCKRAPKVKGIEPLLTRVNGNQHADIVRFLPLGSNHMTGFALRIHNGDQLIFSRFRLFGQAVEQGNSLVPAGKKAALVMPEIEDKIAGPELKLTTRFDQPGEVEPNDADYTGYAYEQGGIRTVVAHAREVHPPGFAVLVFVDGKFITRVLKDQDQGGFVYTLPRAIKKAQDLLSSLQGWWAAHEEES